jgi:hypothetical protein
MSPVNRKRVEKTISGMAFKKGSWDMYSRKLWLSLHGCEYRQGPKVDVLFNVLLNMGIYSNMKVFFLST